MKPHERVDGHGGERRHKAHEHTDAGHAPQLVKTLEDGQLATQHRQQENGRREKQEALRGMIVAQHAAAEHRRQDQTGHEAQQSRDERPRTDELDVLLHGATLAALVQLGQTTHRADAKAKVGGTAQELGGLAVDESHAHAPRTDKHGRGLVAKDGHEDVEHLHAAQQARVLQHLSV